MSDVLRLTIPGEPVAQGRPRFRRFATFVSTYDPPKSRKWKQAAARAMQNAVGETAGTMPAFPEGALELTVVAVFACPKSDERKRTPAPARWKASTPDAENVAKAVQDAGKGILWTDDAQVARLVVDKVFAAQGDEPRVVLEVRQLVAEFVPLVARLVGVGA